MLTGTNAPSIIPQSPEAGNLGRYGSLPITSATGQMSYAVPFYTINVDGNSWPVALNYNYGGLILEGKPSLMGLGWNLQGEAAVTREIRGLPDEAEFGYYSVGVVGDNSGRTVKQVIDDYFFYEEDNNSSTQGLDTWNIQTLRNFRDGSYDAEVDKFNVNVGSLNFSFKLKNYVYSSPNGHVISAEPYFLSKHANKVTVEWANRSLAEGAQYNSYVSAFEVTDTNGVVYRFDVLEKVVPSGIDEEFQDRPATAWKLSKITYLNNDEITFEYDDNTYLDYNFRASGSTLRTNGVYNTDPITGYPNGIIVGPYDPDQTIEINPRYGEGITESEIERKILSRINFPKGRIDFNHSNINGRRLYTNFRLYDKVGTANPVTIFNFQYSGTRDLLDKIDFNNEKFYEFQYHEELSIPSFIESVTDLVKARKQDQWKFYNGSGNPYAINMPNSPFNGANTSPNLLYSRLGALKRITYPTGGSTNIYYQQNQIKTDFIADSDYYESLQKGKTFTFEFDPTKHEFQNNELEIVKELVVTEPTVAIISNSIEGERCNNYIQLSLTRRDGQSNYPITFDGSTIAPFPGNNFYYDAAPYLRQQIEQNNFPYTIPPMYPTFVDEYGPDDGACGYNNIQEDSSGKILMMPGVYVFRGYSSIPITTAKGEIKIDIFGEFNAPLPDAVNKDVGGIRVDYTKDCPDGSANSCFITNYDYNDESDFSTGRLYRTPLLKTNYILEYRDLGETATKRREITSFIFDNYTVNDLGTGSPVFYSNIKTIKTKNGSVAGSPVTEIGYTENTYSFPYENTAYQYPERPTGKDLDKSLVLETKVYGESSENVKSRSLTLYTPIRKLVDIDTQQDQDNNHPWSLKVFINKYRFVDFNDSDYNILIPSLGSPADTKLKALHGILPYRELDIWDRPIEVIKRIDSITTNTAYQYNSNQQVIEQKTIDSRGNETVQTTKYANDFSELNDMAAINQLGTPVESETTYNNKLLSSTKTEFILNANGYKPLKTYTAKGNSPLEAKLKISYDGSGKVIQVDQLLDSPNRYNTNEEENVLKSTAYIWGYGGEFPVVKADNVTYNQLTTAGANLNNLKNSTAALSTKKNELNTLRNALPQAFITGYTYRPLIGISNMIDSRGYTTSYQYDNLNRLLNIKDENEKMLQEFEYDFRSANYTNPDDQEEYTDLGGSISGADSVDFGSTLSYTVNPTGGSGNFGISWYQDGNFLVSNETTLDIVFSSGSSSTISVDLSDNITGQTITITKPVTISSDLGTIQLTASSSPLHINDLVTISKSGNTNGSGNLSYEWLVDNNTQAFNGANDFQTSFTTPGTHVVKLIITDNETSSTAEGTVNIQVYNELSTPTLTANLSNVLTGQNITFTPGNVSGGGVKTYQWYVNGAQQSFNQYSNYVRSFSSAGTYEIRFRVTDGSFNEYREASVSVQVYNNLNVGAITANPQEIIVGSTINFSPSSVSGGTNNKSYQWLVAGVQQSTSSGSFSYNQFSTANDYTVTYRVTDNILNISDQSSLVVTVHNPLNNPSFTQPVSHIEVGDNLYMPTTNIGGGSGSRNYKWYVKFNNGNYSQIQGANNTYLTYDSFSNVGTYTIKFRVTDNNVPSHYKEVTKVVNVYGPIQIANSDITTPSPVDVNTTTYFNINTASGGSGNFEYEWDVTHINTNYNVGVGRFNEANRNYSGFLLDSQFIGFTRIQCRVWDLLTGNYKTVSQTIDVDPLAPLSGLSVGTRDVDRDPESAQYNFNANSVTGGSGDYNYRWVINGSVVQEGPSNSYQSVFLNCSKQSETVTCVAIDNVTGQQILRTVTVNLGFNCGGQ
jgi:hypothetical protein